MARPKKTNLNYFPLDTNFDDNVELLEAECGLEGLAILIKLWQKIYNNSYYIEWNEDVELLFARKINSELIKVNSVVNACLRRGIFDKCIYEKYGVLTSSGIQKRYISACAGSKRKNIAIIEEYLLVGTEYTELTTELTTVSDGINPEEIQLNQEESTQKKRKESKREEKIIKEKEKEKKEDYRLLKKESPKPDDDEFYLPDEKLEILPENKTLTFLRDNFEISNEDILRFQELQKSDSFQESRAIQVLDKMHKEIVSGRKISKIINYFVAAYKQNKDLTNSNHKEIEKQYNLVKDPSTRGSANKKAIEIFRSMSRYFREMSESGICFYSDGNINVKTEFFKRYKEVL